MTNASHITRDGNYITLHGDLTHPTARQLFTQTPSFGSEKTTVDLTSIRNVDSAGLALLVHWSNRARASSAQLKFTNTSTQLQQLAKITDLENLFQ